MSDIKPAWVARLLELYQTGAAHAFIIHFNTGDYVSAASPTPVAGYLAQLVAGRQVVASYSRDRGVSFLTESMRQQALKMLGLAQRAEESEALAALRSIGAAPAGGEAELPRAPAEALPLLDRLLRIGQVEGDERASAVIIERAELVLPDADLSAMSPDDRTALATISRWGTDPQIVAAGNPVFLVVRNLDALHRELRTASSRFEAIQAPLPDATARRAFIARYLQERQPVSMEEGLTLAMVANATAGLSLLHVEDILLRASAAGQLTGALVWERKRDIVRTEFGDVLEIIQPRLGFEDIGGLETVKQFFRRSVIRPLQEGRANRAPMGILMTGPAGTGKSIMAEAVAKEAGVNAVRLRIGGQIASKWQGEGERNLEKALRAVEGLAPTIVFIDEIDQAVRRGDAAGGSQQDQRIFQRLLEWMSDGGHRGQVVVLAATNRPDLMDAALRRPGRFDKKIPLLVPDGEERTAIFRVLARRYLGQRLEIDADTLGVTEGWTGAEIEAAAVKAVELVEDEGLAAEEAVRQAVRRLSPSTADIEFMTMLAVRECNDRDLLPPRYRALLDDRAQLNQRVQQAGQQAELARRPREL
jgi:AAA+ superfamily predicted ATPase